ncbi:M48 family metallopeptidase [Marinicella rhabdoformis]|uniref:M48 family metallopeptidase n=1 Tax=Marinicella rhabdoformis TaxID=2580566 RepID=UPI0012AEC90A|nr:M48 family metallopeptidase [Marinicella rhabdoformis]
MNKLIIIACVFLTACATSPTGRQQLILVGDSQMTQMGITSFQEMKTSQTISRDREVNQYVQCVTNAILDVMPQGGQDWEVVVFEAPSANAFALPGGKIGVHTGLLAVAETPAQLATVIGHEIGHVLSRHGAERVSHQLATQTGLQLADVMASQKIEGSTERQMLMLGLGLGAQLGVLLPYSREHESEADVIGLDLMAQAGFNPQESVSLWQNMDKASGSQRQPQFMSTHPNPQKRIQRLQRRMPKALPLYQNSGRKPNCQL